MCPIDWVFSALLATCVPLGEPPEEVLRTEIYTHARSPLDGQKLTAGEYALLQEALRDELSNAEATLSPRLRHLVQLLRVRKMLQQLTPF
ncbi:MAG: hypothetical protein RMK91_11155 [Pseudanabaenaceae cyanobacterium SKYGB_i_bin29]|nr:hypothetical protein [Pseudanabaenaceae cyanobacterium SKYG29]MDW8422412.1 hypothetical protein [Pseudanabaenaceae cyanobacterium SKYGB_i_bin29]